MKLDFFKKNDLDEFQEQKLQRIERDSFWILYWMLFAVMAVQVVVNLDPAAVAGEWVCFMVINVIMLVRCIRNGIWDRRIKPGLRANLTGSIIAAVAVFILTGVAAIRMWEAEPKAAAAAGAISAVVTWVMTYTLLTVLSHVYRKRLEKLEECEEEE